MRTAVGDTSTSLSHAIRPCWGGGISVAPAGTFEHCLHLKETTPLEGDVSHKWYAPGVGMVKDDEFELAERP